MKAVSLFSGIGGFDLGLERAGIETILQVEIDPFCRRVLEKHWPNVRRIADVREVTAADCAGADLIYGGFPCQPVSTAGRRLGVDDERWLWPEFFRLVRLVRPRYVLMENVSGLLSRGMGIVVGDMASIGYDCEWESIPAAAVGAPHLRYRVFIVSHPASVRRQSASVDERESEYDTLGRGELTRGHGKDWPLAHAASERQQGQRFFGEPSSAETYADREAGLLVDALCWRSEPDVGRVANGVPFGVERLTAIGNAVVPQVAEYVGRRLLAFDAQVGTGKA